MVNKIGTNIDLEGTPNILASRSLYELVILVLCFFYEGKSRISFRGNSAKSI